MPLGQPEQVPQDGLTTRKRRNRPLTIVHTGQMKGKSTAAFGLAKFHRTQVVADSDGNTQTAWGWQDGAGRPVTEGLAVGAVHASYLHLHWAGYPALATRFVARASEAA